MNIRTKILLYGLALIARSYWIFKEDSYKRRVALRVQKEVLGF